MNTQLTHTMLPSTSTTVRSAWSKVTKWPLLVLSLCLLSLNGYANATNLDLEVNLNVFDALCGSENGAITSTVSGGVPPYSYAWSNGANTAGIVDLAPGTYTLTVTDDIGTEATATATVAELPSIQLLMGASYETCVGSSDGNVSVNASGGSGFYDYLWNTGDTWIVIENASAGTYTVTVTDQQTGCTAVGSVELELSPEGLWLMTMGTDVTCNGGNDGTGHVSVMTGTAPFTIVWSDGQTGEDPINLEAGTYTVTATDANGCTNEASLTINEPPAINASTQLQDEDCGQANGSITLSVSGGTPGYTYAWSNSATSANLTNLSAGDYTVTITDANACTLVVGPLTINDDCVPPPCVVDAGTLNIDVAEVCLENGSATVSATPNGDAVVPTGHSVVYLLTSGPNANILQTSASPSFVVNALGNYTLHTLVYDPAVLDLGIIVLGTTTAADLNGLLICGDLDLTGAPVLVKDCPDPCLADAGNLTIDAAEVCFDNGTATVSASPNGNAVVPAGYNTLYVLTSGANLVIQQTSATPSFVVSAIGNYTIHTLVYDPNTLDLSGVVLGTTTGGDINALLIQGGGIICGSLDVAGAPVLVKICCTTPVVASVVVIEATCGNADGSGTITMVGNNADYTYTWSTTDGVLNSIGNARTELPSGIYSVTISNPMPNCPEIVEMFTIGNSDNPDATLVGSTPATCNETNGTATMSNLALQYSWCNGETGYNPTMLPAGVCQVTITDPVTNCIDIMEVIIEEFNPLTLEAVVNNNPDCGQANGSVTINVSNGSFNYSYLWNDGNMDATRNDLASGSYSVTVTDNGPTGCVQTINFILTDNVPGAVIAVTEPVTTTCVGTDDATVDFSITYDPAFALPATVVIKNEDTGEIYQNGTLIPGEYCIVVTDANNCIAGGACFTVTEPSQIDVDIAIDNSCVTGPAINIVEVIGGNGGYTFDWADIPGNMNTQNRPDLEAGSYDVTVTDINGCTAAANNLVVIDTCACPPIILSSVVIVEANCGESNGKVSVNVSGDPSAFNYAWSTGTSGSYWVLENLPSGTYAVTITDLARPFCNLVEAFSIGTPDGPDVDYSTTPSICGVDNGQVTFSNPAYEYTWSDIGLTGNIRDNIAGGTYFVTITDPATPDCEDILTVVVPEESPLTITHEVNDAPSCGQADGTATINVSGGSSNYSYSWGNSATQSGLSSGAYEVVITDDDTGCTGSTSFVLVDDVPNATVTVDAEAFISCPGATNGMLVYNITYATGFALPADITIEDTDGNTYDNGSLPAGIFCVTIRDANGCLAGGDCFEIKSPPQIDVDIAVYNEDCSELGAINLVEVIGGTGAYQYSWTGITPAITDSVATNLEAGTYSFTVTDDNNCQVSENLNIIDDPESLTLEVTPDMILCSDEATLTATSDNATEYNWYDGNNTDLGDGPSIIVNPIGVQTYYVEVVNGDCSQLDSIMVTNGSVEVEVMETDTACVSVEHELVSIITSLDASDELTYDWTPDNIIIGDENTDTPTILIDAAGEIELAVEITNQYNCTHLDTILIVTVDSVANDQIITDRQCDGYTVEFTLAGANAPYEWNFGDPADPTATAVGMTTSHTYSGSGIYNVQVIIPAPADCFTNDTIDMELEVMDLPLSDLGYDWTVIECSDSLVIELADTSSTVTGDIVSWEWTIGGDVYNDSSTIITIYESQDVGIELIVTNEDDCIYTLTDTIPFEIIDVDIPEIVIACPGVPTYLDTVTNTGYVYEWTPADSLDSGTISNPIVTTTEDIMFEVTISDSMGMCAVQRTVFVEVSDPMNLMIDGDEILCSDDPISLTASGSGNIDYVWSTQPDFSDTIGTTAVLDDVVPDYPNATPQVYYVMATDANGCESVLPFSPISYGFEIILSGDSLLCLGDTTELFYQLALGNDAEYPFENLMYEWTGNGIISDPTGESVFVAPGASTNISLTIMNFVEGCDGESSMELDVTDLSFITAEADPDTIFLTETSQLMVTGGDGLSYLWTPSETLDNNEVNDPVASPEETTIYDVEIVDGDSECAIERTVTVTVITPDCDDPYIFLPNAFSPNGDGYNDVLYLRGLDVTEVFFAIYNRWGEKVFESNSQNVGWDGTFNNKELCSDVYGFYLRVRCGNGEEYYKQGNVTLFR